MANLFQKLEFEAFRAGITPRTKESMAWFRRKAGAMTSLTGKKVMNMEPIELQNRQVIGSMFMYFYDPKTKAKLPYYDTFPLSVIVSRAPGGFYGLNLHYLAPTLRAKFLDALMDITNNKSISLECLGSFKISFLSSFAITVIVESGVPSECTAAAA